MGHCIPFQGTENPPKDVRESTIAEALSRLKAYVLHQESIPKHQVLPDNDYRRTGLSNKPMNYLAHADQVSQHSLPTLMWPSNPKCAQQREPQTEQHRSNNCVLSAFSQFPRHWRLAASLLALGIRSLRQKDKQNSVLFIFKIWQAREV